MKSIATITAAVTCAALVGLPAVSAQAKGGGAEVRRSGDCTASTNWKLKAKQRDGRLEVEFEVDSNRVGQKWNWSLRRNGNAFASGTATTVAPSGSFSIERRASDGAGTDVIGGRARNPRTGEVCRASLAI